VTWVVPIFFAAEIILFSLSGISDPRGISKGRAGKLI
jgi:hypothetical protein